MGNERTLLFAGTFDPFHLSHLCILFSAINKFKYDNIEIVIHNYKYRNHKRMFAPEFIRNLIYDMVEGYKSEILDKVHVDVSYDESFYHLIKNKSYVTDILFGSDSYNTINQWKNFDRLKDVLRTKNIIVIKRNNKEVTKIFGDEIILEYNCIEINDEFKHFYSGTLIRNRIKEKLIKNPRYITLPDNVALSAVLAVVKNIDTGEYIMIKHKPTNTIALPGGFIDEHSIEKVLFKELEEELGLCRNDIIEHNQLAPFVEINMVTVIPYLVYVDNSANMGNFKDVNEVSNILKFSFKELKNIYDKNKRLFRFESHFKLIKFVEENF